MQLNPAQTVWFCIAIFFIVCLLLGLLTMKTSKSGPIKVDEESTLEQATGLDRDYQ